MCQNSTNSTDFEDCFKYNETRTNETVQVNAQNSATNSDFDAIFLEVKYYCEGVILVPLAIFGLFGKY